MHPDYQQFQIKQATATDRDAVASVITRAAEKFGLVDTLISTRLNEAFCNYSEGLGWGFGLGAFMVHGTICVGLNPAKATPDRYQPVFDYIANELQQTFGDRLYLAFTAEHIDIGKLPRGPITPEVRAFFSKLIEHRSLTLL